jgi:hypothetical protein
MKTTKKLIIDAAISIAMLLIAFCIGRCTKHPTERVVTIDREVKVQVHDAATTSQAATRVETRLQTVWVTKTVRSPDGTKVTERTTTQGGSSEATTKASLSEVVHDVQVKTIEVVKYKETKTALPNWHITGRVGTGFDALRPTYGVEAQRRILGPCWAGVWIQGPELSRASLAAGFAVGFSF